jgi:hypothetical protein
MTVRKLSIALDPAVASAAAVAADNEGLSLSAWLNRAATRALALDEGRQAIAEWEAEHGAITEEELAAAGRFLATGSRQQAS